MGKRRWIKGLGRCVHVMKLALQRNVFSREKETGASIYTEVIMEVWSDCDNQGRVLYRKKEGESSSDRQLENTPSFRDYIKEMGTWGRCWYGEGRWGVNESGRS